MFHYSGFGCGWGGQAVQKAMNKSQNAYLFIIQVFCKVTY